MCALPGMALVYSSFISCFPAIWLRYFLNDFEMIPFVPVVMGITFFFTFHVRCVAVVRSLCFRIFLASFLITFLSPEIAASISICYVLFIVRDSSQETMCLHFIFIL